MFSLRMRERTSESVVIPTIDAVTFEDVLRFIYTGDAIIEVNNIFNLIVASNFLGFVNIVNK